MELSEVDQVLGIVEKKDPLLFPVVATAIYGGFRREELVWLTKDDLDLDAKTIRIRSKTVGGEFWEPKTKKNRTVPLSNDLHRILAGQALRAGSSVWLFASPRRRRWDANNISKRLAALMAEAMHPTWTFQVFRHTFGSLLAQRGVSDFEIAELMGNSPEIVRKHYARLRPERMHDRADFRRQHA
ncbi:MAG: site-specific integrase [Planctomycetes bacterium]|nr:site-specific integrase [Planctomycetota bacterium]